MMIRSFKELRRLRTFEERFEYCKLGGIVGEETFGSKRYLNQMLYSSLAWKEARREVILRDNGYDLGVNGFEIHGKIYIHHINPITIEDILKEKDWVFDPGYLISTSFKTHEALHYGDISMLNLRPVERRKNDMCPWLN